MNNQEQMKRGPAQAGQEIQNESNSKNDVPSLSKPIKVSDDSDSNEILVFTSHHNVYKVQKKEISDKFQALQKIEFEPGEKPIYLTGEKHYKGFLIVAFENGKIAKISMISYQTEYNRKKLKNESAPTVKNARRLLRQILRQASLMKGSRSAFITEIPFKKT